MDNEDEILFQRVRLREDIRRTLGPGISSYLENRAQEDRLNALRELEKVSPCAHVEIAKLQVAAQAAARAVTWLENAIEEGNLAEARLSEKDEIDNGY